MKEPSTVSPSPLGYLAAFTLGIICMGAIIFFTGLRPSGQHASGPPSGIDPDPTPKKSHFQRDPQIATSPRTSIPRAVIRHPVPVANTEVPETSTESPDSVSPVLPVSSERATLIVNQRNVIADHADALPIARENTRVAGRVTLVGPRPLEKVLPLDAHCARLHPGPITTRFYVTGKDNGLAETLIVVTAGLPQKEWRVPKDAVTLRLRGCIYENHVVAVQAKQPLLVRNLDNTVHNVHVMSRNGPDQSRALLPRHGPLELSFSDPERFLRFKCDVHPWEFAYVNVIEHPFFAITDQNGNFVLNELPPGQYTIQAHHRKAGILQKEITVEENRGLSIEFEFKAPAPPALEI